MSHSVSLDQRDDEDHAATLRDRGHSWSAIADTLGTTPATAKLYAQASDKRLAEHHASTQYALFPLGD